MSWTDALICVGFGVFSFLVGLFLNNFLRSGSDKKTETVATKKDIAVLAKKADDIQNTVEDKLETLSSDSRYKSEIRYKQYSQLYCRLYALIMQSEYLRYFINLQNGEQSDDFNESPLVEMGSIDIETVETESYSGNRVANRKIVDTRSSKNSKKELCDTIVKNAEFASQKLLKIATSYRVASLFYSANGAETENDEFQEKADAEELRLIKEVVTTVVREYNEIRKELLLSFDDEEITKGLPKM